MIQRDRRWDNDKLQPRIFPPQIDTRFARDNLRSWEGPTERKESEKRMIFEIDILLFVLYAILGARWTAVSSDVGVA